MKVWKSGGREGWIGALGRDWGREVLRDWEGGKDEGMDERKHSFFKEVFPYMRNMCQLNIFVFEIFFYQF